MICLRYGPAFSTPTAQVRSRGAIATSYPTLSCWALHHKPLPITGTGEETRDYTFVGDIVDGLLRAGVVPDAVGEAFNLASGEETRTLDLANWINTLTENDAGVTYISRRKWDTHSRRLASVDKARELVGYEPNTSMQDGLRKTVEWFQTHWDLIESSTRF